MVAHLECFCVGPVFDRLARQFIPLAEEKGLTVRFYGGNIAVYSDPVLLERILGNLLANAIQYTNKGRIILGVRRVQKTGAGSKSLTAEKGYPKPSCNEFLRNTSNWKIPNGTEIKVWDLGSPSSNAWQDCLAVRLKSDP